MTEIDEAIINIEDPTERQRARTSTMVLKKIKTNLERREKW